MLMANQFFYATCYNIYRNDAQPNMKINAKHSISTNAKMVTDKEDNRNTTDQVKLEVEIVNRFPKKFAGRCKTLEKEIGLR